MIRAPSASPNLRVPIVINVLSVLLVPIVPIVLVPLVAPDAKSVPIKTLRDHCVINAPTPYWGAVIAMNVPIRVFVDPIAIRVTPDSRDRPVMNVRRSLRALTVKNVGTLALQGMLVTVVLTPGIREKTAIDVLTRID